MLVNKLRFDCINSLTYHDYKFYNDRSNFGKSAISITY